MFLTLDFASCDTARQVEFVLSEKAARQLGEALTSGSVGVMQEFSLSVATAEKSRTENPGSELPEQSRG